MGFLDFFGCLDPEPSCKHDKARVRHKANEDWIRIDHGYWSDGAYRRRIDYRKVLPDGTRGAVYTSDIVSETRMRSLTILECPSCNEVVEKYSQWPIPTEDLIDSQKA